MKLRLLVPVLAVAGLSLMGCGAGKNQNPVASDEQLATTHPADAFQDAANTYTTRLGDSLGAIAARPEVYGDPELWPLLADANGDRIKDPDAGTVLPEDLLLDIPRGLEGTVLDVARERARSAQAQVKAADKPKRRGKAKAVASTPKAKHSEPVAAPAAQAVEPAVEPTAEPTVQAAASNSAPAATPVPAAKPASKSSQRSVFPLFLLLLLLLGALGAILAYFLKRDKQEGA